MPGTNWATTCRDAAGRPRSGQPTGMLFACSCSSTCALPGNSNALAKRSSNELPPGLKKARPSVNVVGWECPSVNSGASEIVSKLAKRPTALSGFTEPRESQASGCLGWIISETERVGGAAGNSSANPMTRGLIAAKSEPDERHIKLPLPAQHLSIVSSRAPRTPVSPLARREHIDCGKEMVQKSHLRHWTVMSG
jgi:hypothetical protein